MVLSADYVSTNIEDIKRRTHSFKVLKTEHLQFEEDEKRLDQGIYIANLCNSFTMLNDFFEGAGISKKVDFSILNSVLGAIYTNTPFTDEELENFFAFNREIESLAKSWQNISPALTEHIFIPSEVEMILIGFDLKQQIHLENMDKTGQVYEEFFNLKWNAINEEITVKEFKKQALNLLYNGIKEKE